MRNQALAAVLIGLVLPACGSGGSAGGTPEATFEAVKSRTQAQDWNGFMDLMAPSGLQEAEKQWEEQKKEFDSPEGKMGLEMMAGMVGLDADELTRMSFRELFTTMMGKMSAMGAGPGDELEKFRSATIVDTTVEGDRATVKFKAGDEEGEMEMVREGGRWYLGGDMLKGMPHGR